MKKQLICLLLVIAMVAVAVSGMILPASAGEVGNEGSGEVLTYDDLYVKNGMTLWLDATEASTVDMASGAWTSLLDASVSAQLVAEGSVKWTMTDKGVSYRFPTVQTFASEKTKVGIKLPASVLNDDDFSVEASFLPHYISGEDNVIVPHSNEADGGSSWGCYTGARPSISIAGFQMTFFHPSIYWHESYGRYSGLSMGARFYYQAHAWDHGDVTNSVTTTQVFPFGTYGVDADFGEGNVLDETVKSMVFMSIDRRTYDDLGLAYKPTTFTFVLGNVGFTATNGDGKEIGSKETKNTDKNFFPLDGVDRPFELFFGFPATVYTIRAYNRVLSEQEHAQNKFADIAKLRGIDLAFYSTLGDEVRALAHTAVVKLGFEADMATYEEAIVEAQAEWQAEQDRIAAEAERRQELLDGVKDLTLNTYDKYYVQDGLVMFFDAFVSLHEWNTSIDLEAGTWQSKVAYNGEYIVAELGGAAKYWKESANGKGIGYRLTKDEYTAALKGGKSVVGIMLDPSYITKEYTVETVCTMAGLTNPDGTRYVDPPTGASYGIYTSGYATFSIGCLKAMAFVCKSLATHGTDMAFRWCYTPKEWGEHNGSETYVNDSTTAVMGGDAIYAYNIVKREPNVSTAVVNIYANMETFPTVSARYNMMKDPEPEFNLFRGLPSTVYAIRIYDRALSLEEQSQNHMADLISFYHLDTTFLDMVLETTEDPSSIYVLFNAIGFDMAKEEAAVAFRDCLVGAWIQSLGLSARLDNRASLRAVFEMNEMAIASLLSAGYKVEAGALLTIGGDVVPTVDANDYRFVFLGADGSRDDAYYLSYNENGYSRTAVQLDYIGFTPEMATTDLNFAVYIVLTTPDGEEITLYGECTSRNYDYNLLSHYDFVNSYTDAAGNAFVGSVIDRSYEYITVEMDAEGGDDANAIADGPIKSIERLYELLGELLNSELPVDITVNFASGTYRISERMLLEKSAFSQKYYRLAFIGEEDDQSILTGNVAFEGNFTPVEGEGYYVHQFEVDEEGNYPDFRFFYVDGVVQRVAVNGFSRSHEAQEDGGYLTGGQKASTLFSTGEHLSNMWVIPYNFDGIDNSTSNPNRKLYLQAEAFENTTEEDFAKMEFHSPRAWYYRVYHLDRVDWNDTIEDGKYVAVYFRWDEIKSLGKGQHTWGNWYFWLENALSFVDEPGEYYYAETEGKLYYYPREDVDMENATFEYPVTDHLLSFHDMGNITFENLVFTGNDNQEWEEKAYNGGQASSATSEFYGGDRLAALYFDDSFNIVFRGCLFHDIATMGVKFTETTKNVLMDSNRFFKIGSSAMEFGQHSGTWIEGTNTNEYIEIYNNYLNDIAWLTRGSVGIYVSVGKYIEIHQNTVMNTSYTGISIGWRWAPVEWAFGDGWHLYEIDVHNNYFAGVMSDQSDGGAVYTLGGNVVAEGNHYHFNYLHHNYFWFTERTWNGLYHTMVMPYYHDGASSNWHTYENVEVLNPYRKVHTTIYLQNIIEQRTHNILVELNEIVAAYKTWEQYDGWEEFTDEDHEYAIFGSDGNRKKSDDVLWETGSEYKYYSRVDDTRWLEQRDNTVYDHPVMLEIEAGWVLDMIEATGSDMCLPDVYEMLDIMCPIYDQWYEDLENAYYES